MFIKQISVYLENRQGRLAQFTSVLADNGIDLMAATVADTTDFGIVRVITKDFDKAVEVLKKNGYSANVRDVLAISVPDKPGGLAEVLNLLNENNISVEYLYSLVRRLNHQAIVVCRVDKPEEAVKLLTDKDIKLISQQEISQ